MEISPPLSLTERHLRDYLHVIEKRKWLIIGFFLLVVGAAAFFVTTATPLYRSTERILIEKENPNVIDFQEVLQIDTSQSDYYQTQYEMLKSRTLARMVIDRLGLRQTPYFEDSEDMIKDFLDIIDVEPIRNSMLVEVSTLHPDPEEAARIATGVVAAYIDRNLENKLEASRQASDWISARLEDLRTRVNESERKLQDYKEKHRLITIPSLQEESQKLIDMNMELIKAESVKAQYEKRYLAEHPKLIQVTNQIRQLKDRIEEEINQSLGFNRVAIEHGQLVRELESNSRVYDTLLMRLKETMVSQNLTASNVLVVDEAEVPLEPDRPRKLLSMIMAVLTGLVGGIGLAFFREYLDNSVKSPEDVELYLHLNFLGLIPQWPRSKKSKYPGLPMADKPHSTAAESIRAIRTSVLFSEWENLSKVILITSSGPGEGKTFLAANLALAVSQQDKKILLIDADFRRPKLNQVFKQSGESGLSDYLAGRTSRLEIQPTEFKNLDLLCAGSNQPNPAELLGSEKMKEVMKKIKRDYEYIILDATPFLSVTDAAILSKVCDDVIFTVDSKRSDRKAIQRGKRLFNKVGVRILGVVMNRVNIKRQKYYYGHYHYYGYQAQKQKSTQEK